MNKSEIMDWINKVLPLHQRLTNTVKSLIMNILNDHGVDYLSVDGRTKNRESILEKIQRKKYGTPPDQIMDICGIRVITFFESQVIEIGKLIKSSFDVDEKNSLDSDQLLGDDRIGYRSVHYVCSLGTKRRALPEYEAIDSLKFEVQVRTVLQHAWAELAHDRAYKFSGELPGALQRKLNLYSGTLELIDRGFDEISNEIDAYRAKVEGSGLTSIAGSEIDSINLGEFISYTAMKQNLNIVKSEIPKSVVTELKIFGIRKIHDLDKLCTKNFFKKLKKFMSSNDETYSGFLRSIMMYNNLEKYFEKSWDKNWVAVDQTTVQFLESKYGVTKVRSILAENRIDVYSPDDIAFEEDEEEYDDKNDDNP